MESSSSTDARIHPFRIDVPQEDLDDLRERLARTRWGKQAFVAAGVAVMLAPRLLVPALRADLVIRPLQDPPRRSVYAMVRQRHAPAATAADAFVSALTQAAESDVSRPAKPANGSRTI